MIKTTVLLQDDQLTDLIDRLTAAFSPSGLQAILEEGARRAEKIIVLRYPAQTNAPLPRRYQWGDGTLHKFPSLKAQRGFFAALKSGKIRVPYRRTGTLARSLQFQIEPQANGITVRVSVPEQIGKFKPKWVVGTPQEQTGYFRNLTNWKPLATIIQKQEPEITDAVRVSFENIAKDLRLGT